MRRLDDVPERSVAVTPVIAVSRSRISPSPSVRHEAAALMTDVSARSTARERRQIVCGDGGERQRDSAPARLGAEPHDAVAENGWPRVARARPPRGAEILATMNAPARTLSSATIPSSASAG